ncbi:cache domain-containing sensor histidine kinase [Paenibacillus xylaniclasticus]|uniref:cache domain-containing sensor histidine kinase n=1 Tax=Paenibacillus xylaniclasticus TaxID=588083 RepID=UPI001773B9B0|nr:MULTISPECIES: sensor histidine kinase [Paenibacillus]GFN32832.1 sensor histidine kinase YesM [Paenibacillus curdlanolyticus]
MLRVFRSFRSIRNRLFILLIISMIGLLSIVTYLYYQRATEQYHDKVNEIAEKNVRQTMRVYDLLLDSYNGLSKSLATNADLLRMIDNQPDNPALAVINERSITNILGNQFYSRNDIVSIHIFTNSGATYTYGNYPNAVEPNFTSREWYNRLKKSDGGIVWLGLFKHSLTDQTIEAPVFAYGRLMYDLLEHKPIGVLLIQMKADQVTSALINMRLGPDGDAFILADDGRMLASDDPSEAANVPWSFHADEAEKQSLSAMTAHTAASEVYDSSDYIGMTSTLTSMDALELLLTLNGTLQDNEIVFDQRPNELVVASIADKYNWTFISRTPNRNLNVEFNQTQHYFVLVLSILLLVSIAIASFIARTISLPLKRIVQQMRQVENGNFRGSVHTKSSYEETDILVSSFNHMVHRMNDLIEREKESSAREKQAQLQALQSQVNPHFLYNTLDMIYWMMDEQGNDRLSRIVLSLSYMFRYSSNWDEHSNSTLGEELEMIRHYLTIIEARLEDRLTADIEVKPEFMDVQIPKMTLQPIIENAVKHGLEPALHPGLLQVYAEAEGQRLQITIADNGVGIDPLALAQLQAALGQQPDSGNPSMPRIVDSTKRKGIGIANVHHRLVLMHGEAYGLAVQSEQGIGTTVRVTLPLPPRFTKERQPE